MTWPEYVQALKDILVEGEPLKPPKVVYEKADPKKVSLKWPRIWKVLSR